VGAKSLYACPTHFFLDKTTINSQNCMLTLSNFGVHCHRTQLAARDRLKGGGTSVSMTTHFVDLDARFDDFKRKALQLFMNQNDGITI